MEAKNEKKKRREEEKRREEKKQRREGNVGVTPRYCNTEQKDKLADKIVQDALCDLYLAHSLLLLDL